MRLYWIFVGVVVVICAFVLMAVAHARDPDGRYANSPNHDWFVSQHNAKGGWCCNDADGHEYDGNYILNADGTVTAEWQGQKIKIEDWKVLHGANPTGHAIWWYDPGENGTPHTYCFALGPLG